MSKINSVLKHLFLNQIEEKKHQSEEALKRGKIKDKKH